MNYYYFHIGDYRRDTTHLSLLEHGVYRQLLDLYYLSETRIPEETEVVYRRLCARSDEEKKAVDTVLSEFFRRENGWIHTRCEREIDEYQSKADRARRNGKLGGRPPKTKVVISGNQERTQMKANQEPITNNQEPKEIDQEIEQASSPPASPTAPPATCVVEHVPPIAKPKPREAAAGTRLPADWGLSQALGEWALTEGMTRERIRQEADRFRDYWIAKPGAAGRKTDWPATWRNWVRRAKETKTGGNNGQSGRPDRESVSARAVREAAEFIADLDAAERAERCQADGSSGIHENELALPWEGVGRL